MNLKKLAEMAKRQRASEEDDGQTEQVNHSEAEPNDEIYIPIDDDEPEQLPDDGYKIASENDDGYYHESFENIIARCFPDEKAYNIELERLIPFRKPVFSADADISALISSIARIGITEPLLVCSAGNGEYEILSGNLRKRAAEALMWQKVPCRIADNEMLSDEDAKLIVAKSNRQRFPALKLSEKIRVAAILGESAASELSLTEEQARELAQLDRLEQDFLEMIDNGTLSLEIAGKLTVLDTVQQKLLLNVLNSHTEIRLTNANAAELCGAKKLTEESIAKILKPKPPVKIAIPAEIVAEYMGGKSPEELTAIVTKAICRYFEENKNDEN